MFKWFTNLFADDPYHIIEPGGTKTFFKEVLKWTAMLIFAILYAAIAVSVTLIVRPAYRLIKSLIEHLLKTEAEAEA